MMHITALDLDRESVTDYNDISYRFMWQDAACGNRPAAQMNTYEEMNVMKAVVVDKNYLIGCLYKDICIKDNNCHIG